jgi:hypothetical protein
MEAGGWFTAAENSSGSLEAKVLSENDITGILNRGKSFYTDDSDIWPLKESLYFLGLVPKIK